MLSKAKNAKTRPRLRLVYVFPHAFSCPISGGRIDMLAKDKGGRLVVIELKVSRGRNPTIGQLLYYMGWVDTNLSGIGKSRGIIVAKDISEDLLLACERIADISLYKYNLSVTATKVYPTSEN